MEALNIELEPKCGLGLLALFYDLQHSDFIPGRLARQRDIAAHFRPRPLERLPARCVHVRHGFILSPPERMNACISHKPGGAEQLRIKPHEVSGDIGESVHFLAQRFGI